MVQCGCGVCSKLGALWAYYPDGAVLVSGITASYICNNRVIGFHRCVACGCLTHWRTLGTDFGRMALNARLLDGCDLAAIPVRVIGGPTAAVFEETWPPS